MVADPPLRPARSVQIALIAGVLSIALVALPIAGKYLAIALGSGVIALSLPERRLGAGPLAHRLLATLGALLGGAGLLLGLLKCAATLAAIAWLSHRLGR